MELPIKLRMAIEKQTIGIKQNQMKQIAQELSDRYRNESGTGKRLLTKEFEAIVYSIVRMPATYGAVTSALAYALKTSSYVPNSLLDVGAGTGAATWGADSLFNLKSIICLEREDAMRFLGQNLMKDGSDALKNAQWIKADLLTDSFNYMEDLVIASYVLNELSEENRIRVLEKLWETTNGMLLIVEPGTPVGFVQLKIAREYLLKQGAHIAAPCPHEDTCKIVGDDWCHFTCRIARSKLHRLLKEGDVPYEDEKFAYIAFTRFKSEHVKARIMRHPYTEKGQISLDICEENGNKKIVVKKKDGTIFKEARKAKCGDGFNYD